MNELMNVKIEYLNDCYVINSRQVAEDFKKDHSYVLQEVSKLKDLQGFGLMFFESTMPDSYGREQRVYYMNRDGFSLIAMGFTGPEAMQWKLNYIEAFNRMEAYLNSPEMIMKRALELAQKAIDEMKPKAEYFDALVDRNLLTNFRDTAKELQIKERDFIGLLESKKIIYRNNKGKIKPYAGYVTTGYFELKEFTQPNGYADVQTLITPKGREALRLMLGKGK